MVSLFANAVTIVFMQHNYAPVTKYSNRTVTAPVWTIKVWIIQVLTEIHALHAGKCCILPSFISGRMNLHA